MKVSTMHFSGFPQATVFIDFLINTYSSTFCRSRVYPCCKFCEPCAVNEYYYQKKCESIMEPKLVRHAVFMGH
jgi:P2X purinoceptor 7